MGSDFKLEGFWSDVCNIGSIDDVYCDLFAEELLGAKTRLGSFSEVYKESFADILSGLEDVEHSSLTSVTLASNVSSIRQIQADDESVAFLSLLIISLVYDFNRTTGDGYLFEEDSIHIAKLIGELNCKVDALYTMMLNEHHESRIIDKVDTGGSLESSHKYIKSYIDCEDVSSAKLRFLEKNKTQKELINFFEKNELPTTTAIQDFYVIEKGLEVDTSDKKKQENARKKLAEYCYILFMVEVRNKLSPFDRKHPNIAERIFDYKNNPNSSEDFPLTKKYIVANPKMKAAEIEKLRSLICTASYSSI